MRIFDNLFNRLGYIKRSGVSNPAQWLVDWVNDGQPTSAGVNVNQHNALKHSPFWAAVNVISGTLASLPFLVYRRVAQGKERASEHPVYRLLHDRPNEFMDALTFLETRQAHVLTYGNGYAEIQRDGGGKPLALWPLLPDRTFRRMSENGVPYYEVRPSTGEAVYLPDYNVLHIKGLGFDGYTGYDVVSYHKESIGYGMAVKEYASRFYSSNASPGGLLRHPGQLSKEAAARLADSWNSEKSGLSQAHRVRVLEEGMEWTPTSVDPEKAQAIEAQEYTVDDCSRIFNIPPHKIGSLKRATFSNIEEMNIDFLTSTMYKWFRKWEQECNYKLFLPSETQKYFCEILIDGLLRGNVQSRYNAYNIGRNAGFLSVNDIREKENMNSIGEDGDIYLEPLNMKPAGTEIPQPEPPKPTDDKEDDDEPDDKEEKKDRSHRDLIISQLMRVITKQNNAVQRGVKDIWWEGHKSWATNVLFDSVNAYASMQGKNEKETRDVLQGVINIHIQSGRQVAIGDAGILTDILMRKLGANNG